MAESAASGAVTSWGAWRAMDAQVYDGAFYRYPLFDEVYREELGYVHGRDWSDTCLVDVGSGPGEFILSFPGLFGAAVGVERSRRLYDHAEAAAAGRPDTLFVLGDASDLRALLTEHGPELVRGGPRLVCCVMNTLGILEPDVRAAVLSEMAGLCGPDDSFLVAVFDRSRFEDAVHSFYATNPDLCGPVLDGDYDVAAGDLRVRSTGYYSHWFEPDEISADLTRAGFSDFTVESRGAALFAFGGRIRPRAGRSA